MKKQLLLASSALALVLTGTAFAGGGEHMAAPAPAPAPAPAAKSGGFYVGLNGGYIITAGKGATTSYNSAGAKDPDQPQKDDISKTTKSGFGFGGAVGYRFGEMPVRVEVGFNYNMFTLTDDAKKGSDALDSMNGYSIMARAFYDFDMGQFVPYVGLGAGYDSLTFKPKTGDKVDNTGLGYEGIIGVDYKINDNFSVGASFTYHGTTAKSDKIKHADGSSVESDLSGVQLMTIGLGLKYFF